MGSLVTPFKVGVVVIGAIASFVFMFGMLSQSAIGSDEGYVVQVHLPDATGLAKRSNVILAGIPVGAINDIALDGTRALVRIRMRPDITLYEGIAEEQADGSTRWVDGATISKQQASLLGDYYLQITPGLRGDELGDGDFIRNVAVPIGPEQLFEKMGAVADNLEAISVDVEEVTSAVSSVLGGERGAQAIDEIVQDLQSMVSALNTIVMRNDEAIGRIVTNIEDITGYVEDFTQETGGSIDGILSDISAMTTELRFIIGQSSGDVAEGLGTLKGTLSSMQLALDNLNYSLENVQEITDRVVDGQGTVGRLINDDGIASETEELLSQANELVGSVNRLQTWVELRSEYGLNENAFKNYLRFNLMPNEDKFYILELVDDPRGLTSVTRTVTVQNDPDEPPTLFEEQTQTTETFKVSFMFGHRWPLLRSRQLLLGGRFGLIESSGGIGADLWALDENLELRMDLFDFGENESARLKLLGLLDFGLVLPDDNIFSRVFLQGGVDDVLNPGPRDFFVGAGISFNDRDLKGLFVTAPTPEF